MNKEYSDKLKDPRWQKKRLEIFERDAWTCCSCLAYDEPLHAHHKCYQKDKEPWEIDNSLLITLCEACHKHETEAMYDYLYKMLIPILKEKFMADDIYSLFKGFYNIKMPHRPGVTSSIIEFTLKNESIMEGLCKEYFNSLKSKK